MDYKTDVPVKEGNVNESGGDEGDAPEDPAFSLALAVFERQPELMCARCARLCSCCCTVAQGLKGGHSSRSSPPPPISSSRGSAQI